MKYQKKKISCTAGFTLLEVLISVFILAMVVTSASTAFAFASKVTRNNEVKMTAVNLANQRMEDIRSLPFAEVGTKFESPSGTFNSGNPPGEILQEEEKELNGYHFMVYTSINWEEQGDGILTGDAEWDYKSVKITVIPQSVEDADGLTQRIETYVTRQSTQPALTGANIRMRFVRGWNEGTLEVPVSGVKLLLESGPSAVRQILTTSKGIGSFIDLTPGNYVVKIDPTSAGMILHPSLSSSLTLNNLLNLETRPNKNFKVEYPCNLHFVLKNKEGSSIDMDSTSTGSISINVNYGTPGIPITKTFTSSDIDSYGRLPNSLVTGLWPVGAGYAGAYRVANINIPNYTYLGSYDASGTKWDGTFSGPNTS